MNLLNLNRKITKMNLLNLKKKITKMNLLNLKKKITKMNLLNLNRKITKISSLIQNGLMIKIMKNLAIKKMIGVTLRKKIINSNQLMMSKYTIKMILVNLIIKKFRTKLKQKKKIKMKINWKRKMTGVILTRKIKQNKKKIIKTVKMRMKNINKQKNLKL